MIDLKQGRGRTALFGGLLLLALLLRLYLALATHYPGSGDHAFYYTVGANLDAGRGFEIDYSWHYFDRPETISHSSLAFWAPLASVLIAVSFRVLGQTMVAALLPGVFFGLLLALPTFLMARAYTPSNGVAWAAAGLILFLPTLFVHSLLTDSVIFYTVLVTVSLLFMVKGLAGKAAGFPGAAIFAALAHMTRLDGLLLLPTLVIVIAISRQTLAAKVKLAIFAIALYLLTLSPWMIASYQAQGTFLPTAPAKAAFMTTADDLFAYSQEITWDRYLDWGVANIVRSKGQALLLNGLTLFQHVGTLTALFFCLGVGLLLHDRARRPAQWVLLPPALFGSVLLFFHTIIAPITGAGSFLRSSHALLPFLLIVAVDGAARSVRSPRIFWGIVSVWGAFFLSEGALTAQARIATHNQQGQALTALTQTLDETLADEDRALVLMAAFPWEVHLATGRQVIPIPTDGRDNLRAAAAAYNVDYVLLPAPRPYLADVYLGLDSLPVLEFVLAVPGTEFKLFALSQREP